MNIRIVNYSRGPLVFDVESWNARNGKECDASAVVQLKYSQNSDFVGMQLDLTVRIENHEVLKVGFLIGFEVQGWKEMLAEGVDFDKDRSRIYDLCDVFWNVATGVIAADTVSEKSASYILPSINIKAFAKDVILRNNTPAV